jgi:hypothetical protein
MQKIILPVIACILLLINNGGFAEEVGSPMSVKATRSTAQDNPVQSPQVNSPQPFAGSTPLLYSELFLSGIGNSVVGTAIETTGTAFEINAMKDSSSALLRIGRDFSFSSEEGLAEFSTWSITAAAPINKKDDFTALATWDGLANSFRLTLRASNFVVAGKRNPFSADPQELPRRLSELCALAGIDVDKGDQCDTGKV